MISLDGSYGEGGGQILRNAAAYAAILGTKDLGIRNIRAGRSVPGLRKQHLTGLTLLAEASGGSVDGARVGSREILFRIPRTTATTPHTTIPSTRDSSVQRTLTGNTETAGSICLLLQAALPFALVGQTSCPIRWILRGGTNASNAPQYDYWQFVFLPMLNNLFQIPPTCIDARVIRRGFFPKGGGEVHVDTIPFGRGCPLPAIQLTERGEVESIVIRSFYSGKCPRHVAERMANTARDYLKQNLGPIVPEIRMDIRNEEPAVASGSGILLVATTSTGCLLGGSAIGSPKVSPPDVGREAARELLRTLLDGGCVDDYLQDQLILYMALAKGTSELITGSLTLHTQTAIWTAEQCCDGVSFQVTPLSSSDESNVLPSSLPEESSTHRTSDHDIGRIPGRHRIQCTGIGFSPS